MCNQLVKLSIQFVYNIAIERTSTDRHGARYWPRTRVFFFFFNTYFKDFTFVFFSF